MTAATLREGPGGPSGDSRVYFIPSPRLPALRSRAEELMTLRGGKVAFFYCELRRRGHSRKDSRALAVLVGTLMGVDFITQGRQVHFLFLTH